jgi:hypothetical protein
MKQLNQTLAKVFGFLLLLTVITSSCKKAQVDPTTPTSTISTLSGTIDGRDLSLTDANLATTYYNTDGDNVNSVMTTAVLDTSGSTMTFFIPDISAGTITIAPKLGTSFNPGVLSARTGFSFSTTTTTTVQAYIVYKINGNTYYAVSGTITTTYDNTKITVTWDLVFKDADGRTFTSKGSYTIYNYKKVVQPKTGLHDPTPVSTKPTINNIAPTSGSPGDSVVIAGTNFSTNLTENVVMFNGVTAVVKSATATKLVVLVPSAGTTGYITVKVKTSEPATGPKFTYLGKPTITGITPASGKAGDAVAITGTNFATAAADNIVMFNGVVAKVTESTGTILRVTAPAGVTTGVVTVTVRGKAAVAGPNVNTTFTVLTTASTGTASILTTQLFGYNFKAYSNDGALWLVDGDGRINKISATAGASNKNYTTADITFTNLTTYVCRGLARDTNGVIHAYIIGSGTGSNANYSAFVISINPSSGVITKDFETTILDTSASGFAITSTGAALLLSSHYGSDDVVRLKTDGTGEVYAKGGTGIDNTLGGTGAYSISVAGPYVYLLTYTKGSPNAHHAIVRFDAAKTRLSVVPSFVEGYADGALTAAKFSDIRCIAVNNKTGDIYVGDFGNLRIRKISTANVVTTVAGNGSTGQTYTGDVLSINLVGTYGLLFDSNHNTLYNFPATNIIQKLVFN